jgi:hypothetical protein
MSSSLTHAEGTIFVKVCFAGREKGTLRDVFRAVNWIYAPD